MSSNIQTTSAMGDDTLGVVTTSATTNLAPPVSHQATMTPTTYGSMVAGGESSSEMAHASGTILSLTEPVVAGGAGYTRVDQPMADAKFADSLHRNVLALKFTTFTANHEESFTPWVTWGNDPFVADKLKNFQYIRGSLVVSGVLKAPPLAAGLVAVSFIPAYEPTSYTPLNPMLSTVLPHVIVDLSASSDFEVTLPWIVSSDWGNLSDYLFSSYWTVQVRVLSPIISGVPDGCASTQLTIFVRPGDDFQLSGATYQSARVAHARQHPSASRPSGVAAGNFNVAKPKVSTPASGTSLQATVNSFSTSKIGMKPSEALSKLGSAGLSLASVPIIGGAAAMVGAAASYASSWASWFGMTRESTVALPNVTLLSSSQNVVNCDGQDHSQTAALFSVNALSIDPAINGTLSAVDETSLNFINSRYTMVGKFQYTVGDTAPQDHLIPVTPCLGAFGVGDTTYMPITSGYQAGKFTFWRGDMKYIFYPVVSAVHRGALQFIWQPIPRSASVPVDMTNISLNAIVDIGAAQPIEVTVGYNNDNPMCYTDFYALDTPLDLADYGTVNGYLRVRAINPIVGTICGQTIDVLVFAAAADNMEFAVPTELVVIEGEAIIWGQGLDIESVLQSATVGAGGQNMVKVDLVPPTGPYPVADILAGEHIKSVRALIQKPSVCWDLDNTVPGPSMPHFHTAYRNNDPCNYFNYFGSQFLAFAGGIRYKVLIDAGLAVGVPTAIGMAPTIQSSLGAMASFPVGQFNPSYNGYLYAVETLAPYYHNEKWVPAYKESFTQDLVVWDNTAPFSLKLATYKSAGPDARLTFFRAQNQWVFVSRDTIPNVAVWQTYGFNGFTPPAPAPFAKGTTEKTVGNKITLDQYRARTGRSEFKVTRRSATRRILKEETYPSLLTEVQATREDAVA